MRVLFVAEFGPGVMETMTEDYIAGLAALRPDMRVRFFHGFLGTYVEGGTRSIRVLNALYMYLRLPFALIAKPVDLIIVRTTPPGIQLWCALLGWIMRIPVGTWMMDYHPEIEARALARRSGSGWLVKIIREIDTFLLRRMKFGIVLDAAMEDLIRARAPELPLVRHPTWNGSRSILYTAPPPVTEDLTRELRLVYAGNLGYSHPLETLARLLVECKALGDVRLFLVGVSEGGQERFLRIAEQTGIVLEVLPRTPFADLRGIFHEYDVHAGIVLLAEELAGLVSPSKFGAYIRFGIATVYIGPPRTSSEAVCLTYGAGFAIHNNAPIEELRRLAGHLRSVPALSSARESTRQASEFFQSRNGDTLAAATAPVVFG